MARAYKNSTLYWLKEVNSSRSFPIYVMQSIGYSYKNSIITYETIGDDGGEVINAGKLIQRVPITIMLIGNMRENMKQIKRLIVTKEPFTIFTSIDTARIFGTYVIESVDGTITDGADAITINVTLVEYKKTELNTKNFVLATTKNLDAMLSYLKNQNLIDKR